MIFISAPFPLLARWQLYSYTSTIVRASVASVSGADTYDFALRLDRAIARKVIS
jgi:hypothetical protein